MPYSISPKGEALVNVISTAPHSIVAGRVWDDLTDWQRRVLRYLYDHRDEGYIPSHTIGVDLKEHGRAISGIAFSLWKKGLVSKKEEPAEQDRANAIQSFHKTLKHKSF